jgi:hypothetical protein
MQFFLVAILTLAASLAAALTCRSADPMAGVPAGQPAELDSMGYPTNLARAYDTGRADARRDASNKVVTIKFAGLPVPEWGDYERLLKERCNVRLEPVAGCLVTSGLTEYLRGYNGISVGFIRLKFGTNILDRLQQEAREQLQSRLAGGSAGRSEIAGSLYRVKAGDTLLKIAREHGIPVRDLLSANPGVDPTRLRINQKLRIPPSAQH